ncbi:hypothetical protein EY688_13035 [Enterococcus casseliflavus]|uniref:hypothetical protein n=1 Tax=Enterococcus casseliflavus TaxID=37734 RepID=UPI001AD62FEE|nr:hypothetical protein [Enterococcus casseliflavus]MBO6350062.1 hypothetical protein [Enterococcus casseliflavus]MBO6366951.1 hypothetical protein [Enterococcus casseliflavus]
MKNLDMEICNYIKKMVEKGTNVSFEKIYNEGFETPLIQITISNGRIKEFIHYDYEHIKSLDEIKAHLDTQISYFNSRICKSSY